MKYAKKSSPVKVGDERTNRGLVSLDEEIIKLGRVVNVNSVVVQESEPDKKFAGMVWVDVS